MTAVAWAASASRISRRSPGLRVRDVLADRKYQGSYEQIAKVLRMLQLHSDNLRFFEQVAFSIMVRNGDAHPEKF